jgi:hypothetical protein
MLRPMSQRVAQAQDFEGKPLLKVASDRVGMRTAFMVLSFMAAWDVAQERLRKRPITLEEYADYWRVTRATAFREQKRFRDAFPGETTPERLLDVAAAQWDNRTGVKGLGAVKLA